MTAQSASMVAILVGLVAVLGSMVYALIRALRIQTRLKRISNSPAALAAAKLPALGERISACVQELQGTGERLNDVVESLTATRDAGNSLQSGVDSIAACVIDLVDTFAPSARGSAS